MVEHASDYEWRGEGEAAEIVLYAPDERSAHPAFERLLPAAGVPGVESPVYGAAAPEGFGWVAVSGSHAAPDLASVPARGLLLVADAALDDLGVVLEEVPRLIPRRLSEVRLPRLAGAGIRRYCETGARAAAEGGLIEEEDLLLIDPLPGDADTLGRKALFAGGRDWGRLESVRAYGVGEVLDAGPIESLGLEEGMLALVVFAGAGELGRLALAGHRERVTARAGDDYGTAPPAVPAGSGEAADLLAALGAAANFADGLAALLVYALRRALDGLAGGLRVRAAWRVGGMEERGGSIAHRRDLAVAGDGEVLVSGGSVVAGKGKMWESVPPFGGPEDGRSWEEAGLLERWAGLYPPEGES